MGGLDESGTDVDIQQLIIELASTGIDLLKRQRMLPQRSNAQWLQRLCDEGSGWS